jgi:hypothetical protein
MKTKKALAGLFGLFGSFAAFFDGFFPVAAVLLLNLPTNPMRSENMQNNYIRNKKRSKI